MLSDLWAFHRRAVLAAGAGFVAGGVLVSIEFNKEVEIFRVFSVFRGLKSFVV